MQSGLDSMIYWKQKILQPVYGRAWNISIDDLKSLGVVLKPQALLQTEQASQELNSVFPPKFQGAVPRSALAHRLYAQNKDDMGRADEAVKCAEIYLGQQVAPANSDLTSSTAKDELQRCSDDFTPHSPTFRPLKPRPPQG
jgi:hypothetical protein